MIDRNQLVDELAKKLWNYLKLDQKLEKADCVLAFGSSDLRVAEGAAQIYLDGWAPLLVFSGGLGKITSQKWSVPEAEKFAQVAISLGVPEGKILKEDKSTNTGENIIFTKRLLAAQGLTPKKIIVVQKPYSERRNFASLKMRWPEAEFICTSPDVEYIDYPNEEINKDSVINLMVGDVQRIKEYANLGYAVTQDIPVDVENAYTKLVALGFDKHLLSESWLAKAKEVSLK